MSPAPEDRKPYSVAPPGTPSAPAGRWRLVLLASLAINLLFAGAFAGSFWQSKRHHLKGGGRGTTELGIQGFLKSIPKERAKELRLLMKQNAVADVEPLISSIRQARREAAAALSAQTYDRDSLTLAFGRIDEAEATAKVAARASLLALAPHMTAAERQAMAARWKARRPHMFEDPAPRPSKNSSQDAAP